MVGACKIGLAGGLAVVALVLAGAAQAQPAPSAKNGARVFETVGCYSCHGRAAHGGYRTGPKLAPKPIPYAAFVAAIRTPRDEMPPYSEKVLSESDLKDIYAWLQTFKPTRGPDQIPELK